MAEQNGRFPGIRASRGGPLVSHLSFADDSVSFGDAIPHQAAEVRCILNVYEAASGNRYSFPFFGRILGPKHLLKTKE